MPKTLCKACLGFLELFWWCMTPRPGKSLGLRGFLYPIHSSSVQWCSTIQYCNAPPHIPVLPGKYLGSPRVLKPNALLLSKVNVHKYNNITMPTHLKCILSGAVACYRRESLSHVAAASKRDACPRRTYHCTYIRRIHIMLPSVLYSVYSQRRMPSSYIRQIHILLPRVFSKMPSYIYVEFISSYILCYPEYYILTCPSKHTDVLSLFKPTWDRIYAN